MRGFLNLRNLRNLWMRSFSPSDPSRERGGAADSRRAGRLARNLCESVKSVDAQFFESAQSA